MVAEAAHPLPLNLHPALAGIGALLDVRDGFQRRRRGHQLKGGAGRIGGGQEAVEVHAGILAIFVLFDRRLRLVVYVKGRGADHAEQLARFVVGDGHRALVAAERLQRHGAEVRVQRRLDVVALPARLEYAVDQAVPG